MFEKGLLTSKATAAGGRVTYATYTVVGGAALPLKITYETITKEKFSLQLEEPEINIPLNDSTFTPDLSKLHVYPLSSLR